ncbi:M23 family metallopeptidase [Chryseobacterium sp. MFBS3-17]|uniref:M23 family metallopeptidase n=1 Tax=Chryseobacterium sp. MFBS3-17 TaxID=2886689 RepID=UPI00293ED555|nr:M23 family metallopeptidase [Chryseobacterium sp. MFBS3-17]
MKKLLLLFFLLIATSGFAQSPWDIRFYNEVKDGVVHIYADNQEPMEMSARFEFKLQNVTSSLPSREIVVVPADTLKFLIATLTPVKKNAANKFSYTNTFNFGNALQQDYDQNHIYSLPFEKGKTQRIYQGYYGKFSHQNAQALDFDLQTGDEIFAAREGIVVETVSHHHRNCPDISCAKFNNRILIQHEDGTFADYAHLKQNGVSVKKGDFVSRGQLIGYSGNTGYSNGPHLHFSVFINRIDGSRTYLPTLFKTSESEGTLLKEGQKYTRNYD